MNEAEKRKKRLCFTGRRPEKLHYDEATVCNILRKAIDDAMANGFTTFISGMARGVDIWAAEIVLEKKRMNPEVRLICALPHPNFEKRWSFAWQKRYARVIAQADLVKEISLTFSMANYQRRNEWMVDHSTKVIAIYNGTAGGTKKTIDYAEHRGVKVDIHEA